MAGKTPIYVFAGFFMSARSKYMAPGDSVQYYCTAERVESKPSWADFLAWYLTQLVKPRLGARMFKITAGRRPGFRDS